jgi:6-phosphogluconate dehydrogenase
MPGGNKDAVDEILPILEKAAADDFNNNKCVTNVGHGASGHFVKMVHNGIEYGIMQGITEVYDILKRESYSNFEISEFFDKINHGEIESFYQDNLPVRLESFLIDITVKILKTKDSLSDQFLIDKIKDVAKAKGTGGWTVEAALELGVYTPTLAAAVFARTGSARGQSFLVETTKDQIEEYTDKEALEQILSLGLESVYLGCFLQGLDLIKKANIENNWDIDLREVLRIWEGGCIIRTKLLANMWEMWQSKFNFKNRVWSLSFLSGFNDSLPLPVLHSSLDYFQTLSSELLPTNLIQAQRDYFGAHTYKRNDKEGDFTGGWID